MIKVMPSRFFSVLLVSFALLSGGGAQAADEPATFTIQAGTYAVRGPAVRQVSGLAGWLRPEWLGDLRVERGEKYFIVRFGRFGRLREAAAALAAVRGKIPDAFILRDPAGSDDRVVFLYPDNEPGTGPFAVRLGRFASRDEAEREKSEMEMAREISGRFGAGAPTGMRIGHVDDSFDILAGFFPDLPQARAALAGLVVAAPGAVITRAPASGSATESPSLKDTGEKQASETAAAGKEKSSLPSPASPSDTPIEVVIAAGAGGETEVFLKQDVDAAMGEAAGENEAEGEENPLDAIDREMNDLLDRRDYGRALALIQEAIRKQPDNPALHAWQGETLLAMDRPDKALEPFRKAAELAPSLPVNHSNVGYTLLSIHMGSARDAIDSFNRALALDPDNADALEGIGSVYVTIGRNDRAEEIFSRLARQSPEAASRLRALIDHGVDWKR